MQNDMQPNRPLHEPTAPLAIVVNGPSSSGKSTLCKALQERLSLLAGADLGSVFARVAFDDIALMLPENRYSRRFVQLQGRDPDLVVSREPHDGLAAFEYPEERGVDGTAPDEARVRLRLSPYSRRLLTGVHLGWGEHLRLGTNLVIDHYLQESDWCDEVLGMLRDAGAAVLLVGVHCSIEELERREAARADGGVEGRPRGLARSSNELCHAHGLDYDVNVWTDRESTAESVEAIVALLASRRSGGLGDTGGR